MARSKRSQSSHDSVVRNEANNLKKQGFSVKADIPGFPRPHTIRGYRPDIDASKREQRKILEVETQDSKDGDRDKAQRKAFRDEANKKEDTTFRRIIANR